MLAVGLSLPIGVFAMIAYGLYRKFKCRTWYESGTCYIGQNIMSEFKPAAEQRAIEEIRYQNQDEREEAFSGDEDDTDCRILNKNADD